MRFMLAVSCFDTCFQQLINIFSTKKEKLESRTKWNNVEEGGILWKKFILLHLRINF